MFRSRSKPPGLAHLTKGLVGRHGSAPERIAAVEAALQVSFPGDLVELLQLADAAEGWVEGGYLQVWPLDRMEDLNRKSNLDREVPGLVLIATDGGGEGYGIVRETGRMVNVPMIGAGFIPATPIGRTLEDLLRWIAERSPGPGSRNSPSSTFGDVLYEKQPIYLGGSPTDLDNKAWVPLDKYVELVAWWNARIRAMNGGEVFEMAYRPETVEPG